MPSTDRSHLGELYIDEWRARRRDHHGKVTEAARETAIQELRRDGHAFCGCRTEYSATDEYGIGFVREALVRDEVARHRFLRLLETPSGFSNGLGQNLAVVRRQEIPGP